MEIDIDKLGLGLSRLIRYFYGGFLFILLMYSIKPDFIKDTVVSLGSSLSVLGVIVIGAGIYVLHRSIIIPIHHLILILSQMLFDRCKKIAPKNSINPVIYIHSLDVPRPWCMIAYSYLRRKRFFKNPKQVNIIHAEAGLLVMTSSFLFCGSCFTGKYRVYQFLFGILFLLASYPPAWIQHALECKEIKRKSSDAKCILKKAGLVR